MKKHGQGSGNRKHSGGRGGGGGRHGAPVSVEDLIDEADKLLQKGERFAGDDSAKALARAMEKYQEVLRQEAGHAEAMAGCGQVMWVSATKELNLQRKLENLNQSVEFFRQSVTLDPSDGRQHFNIGQSLMELAEIYETRDMQQQAMEHYDRSMREFQRAAELHEGEVAAEASEEDREEIRGDLVDSLLSLAACSSDFATMQPDPQAASTLFGAALQAIQRALAAASEKSRPECLIGQGQVHVKMAEYEHRMTGNVNQAVFDAALARFGDALASEHVNPVEGLCERGDALHSHALALLEVGQSGVTDAGELAQLQHLIITRLKEAQTDYETALQLEPETPSIYVKLGDTLLLAWRASRAGPAPLVGAVEAYTRSMNIPFKRNEDPDTLYSLAAAFSLLENEAECRQWLLRWKGKGAQVGEVLQDPDFAFITGREWFAKDFAL